MLPLVSAAMLGEILLFQGSLAPDEPFMEMRSLMQQLNSMQFGLVRRAPANPCAEVRKRAALCPSPPNIQPPLPLRPYSAFHLSTALLEAND